MSKVPRGAVQGVPPDEVLRRLRIPFIRRATLRHRGGTEQTFLVDLGLRGVFVERAEPLPIGEAIEVRFTLPENEIPIEATCRVVWVHGPGVPLVSKSLPEGLGLEFVDLPPAHDQRLREHLLRYYRRHPKVRQFLKPWPQDKEPQP